MIKQVRAGKDPFIRPTTNIFDAEILAVEETEGNSTTPSDSVDEQATVDLAKDFINSQGVPELAAQLSAVSSLLQKLMGAEDNEDFTPLNGTAIGKTAVIEHDDLQFRSKAEIAIYDELKKRDVLFFPNAPAILGGKNTKREPDFLICQNGKWGVLEVMGKHVHTTERAAKDHERARLFNDYGLTVIQFYEAEDCYKRPAYVVDDFLKRLRQA